MKNEPITNTPKPTFPDDRTGRLSPTVTSDGAYCGFGIADDAALMPAEATDKRSFGTRPIATLARRLVAGIAQSNGPGTIVDIRLPLAVDTGSEPE